MNVLNTVAIRKRDKAMTRYELTNALKEIAESGKNPEERLLAAALRAILSDIDDIKQKIDEVERTVKTVKSRV